MSNNTFRCEASRSWVLTKGQAQTFTPATAGVLRIQYGRVWLTMSRTHQRLEPLVRSAIADDDLFLDSTTSLTLRAGQTIVLEAWSIDQTEGVTIVWDLVLSSSAQRWQQTVAQPAHELVQGVMHACRALSKLMHGLLAYTPLLLARKHTLR